jgi:hypothetical protein
MLVLHLKSRVESCGLHREMGLDAGSTAIATKKELSGNELPSRAQFVI